MVGIDASQDFKMEVITGFHLGIRYLKMSTCAIESEQLAAPLEGGWVRSSFFKFKVFFDVSQDFKLQDGSDRWILI